MFCHHQRLTSADGLSPFLQILFEIRQSSQARQTKFAPVNTRKIDLLNGNVFLLSIICCKGIIVAINKWKFMSDVTAS